MIEGALQSALQADLQASLKAIIARSTNSTPQYDQAIIALAQAIAQAVAKEVITTVKGATIIDSKGGTCIIT